MNLQDILEISSSNKKIGLSEERIKPIIPIVRQYISYWREYPDMFVDFLQDGGDPTVKKKLKFYFYQRVFLRAAMRHRRMFATFPRGYSKSFLMVLTQMIRCILYPGVKLYCTADGKSQSAGILSEKVEEICDLVPAFNREIDRRRSPDATKISKDYCKYVFKNGSYIDNMVASEKSRGKRRHGAIFEECVSIDQDILQQVLIPIASISRKCVDGSKHSEEKVNQSELYVTTAGYKADFAYQKLIRLLVESIINPDEVMIMGGTYRIPVLAGQYDKDMIDGLRRDDTFNEVTFNREYASVWSGTSDKSFYDGNAFDRNRIIQKPEYEASGRSSKSSYYVITVDVGRFDCSTVAIVLKVTPQPQGQAIKSMVNIYDKRAEHFEEQAIWLKSLYYKFMPKAMVIDGNGVGAGLVDFMVISQIDRTTGEEYPGFGVINDEDGKYKSFNKLAGEQDAIYIIKANAPINTIAYTALQVALTSGKLKLLIDQNTAKNKLLGTTLGQNMSPERRAEYLIPYTLTSSLKEEMLNLREENEGINIKLKPYNKNMKHDKFSALVYGLYYIKEQEDNKKNKKKFNAKDWLFLN